MASLLYGAALGATTVPGTLMRQLFLASTSPRRAVLLAQIGVSFAHLMPPEVDESIQGNETASDYVQRLAWDKARAGWAQCGAAQQTASAVLGADTCIALDNHILGKPADEEQAVAMLLSLAGREHHVFSAVCIVTNVQTFHALSQTLVRMCDFGESTAKQYVATGEPLDKAGAYGIQGYGAVLVESLSGSYSGVVGLPLAQTSDLLIQAGVPIWQIEEA